MFGRPIRARVRPVTLVGEQSQEVNRKREWEEAVWRAALAEKKVAWQVNHAIWEADRPAHIRMWADAPDPPPRPRQNWYRAPTPMHLGPDPRDRTGEGVWRNGMYFSGSYSPVEGEEERELEW
jgi:hypothetical protein